jgi:hypothetical protein
MMIAQRLVDARVEASGVDHGLRSAAHAHLIDLCRQWEQISVVA